MTDKFSTHCFRDFKKYIGELTATSAGIHVAIKYTDHAISSLSSADGWSSAGRDFDVKIDGLNTNQVLKSAARLNVVSVYSGFDLYLKNFRRTYFNLFQKNWDSGKQDTPFAEFRKNTTLDQLEKCDFVVAAQIKLVEYYRLARNAIVHPTSESVKLVNEFGERESDSLNIIRQHYTMVTSPNNFDELNFHDVKLFARTLLDLLPQLDLLLDPGNERLRALVPFDKWASYKQNRKLNAAKGFLKNEFGISDQRADKIVAH